MPSPSRQYGAALGVLAALLLTGCGGSDGGPADPDAAPSATPTPTATTSATASPTSSTSPAASPSATARPTGLRGLLPTVEELPGLNPGWRWQVERTGRAPSEPFGACAKVEMSVIGASRAVQRDYRPAASVGGADGTDAAVQALEFPDAMTAQRAGKVLLSWHDACRQRLSEAGRSDPNLTPPLQPAGPGPATGWWYLASWATGPDDGHFQAFGVVVHDDRMVLLTMDHDGQDHSYPPGKDPMAQAVRHVEELFAHQA
jgi:hypothetical protein